MFSIRRTEPIDGSERTLYLMERGMDNRSAQDSAVENRPWESNRCAQRRCGAAD